MTNLDTPALSASLHPTLNIEEGRSSSPNNETAKQSSSSSLSWMRFDRLLKAFLFMFGSSVVTYYSIFLFSIFGDIALKSSNELQQRGHIAITPHSFKAYQEEAYGRYISMKKNNSNSQCKLGIVSSFPPARCGIAQFTEDLFTGMETTIPENCTVSIIALHDSSSGGALSSLFRSYDMERVSLVIDLDKPAPSPSILDAASKINAAGFTHILLQSEFGLTPIMWQQADLLRWLSPEITIVTVFHTPRAYPNEEERAFIKQVSRLSKYVVGMSHYSCKSLKYAFGVPEQKIQIVPHGVKNIYADMGHNQLSGTALRKNSNQFILLSDGLIHEHKGYLRMIRALPDLVKVFPNIVFRIIGKQHPKSAAKNLMDSYINEARSLGVRKNIEWIDTYFTTEELLTYYSECDVYLSLYDEVTPISGTITSAMAAGLAIVATPYRYAVELLSDDCGVILPSFDVNTNKSQHLIQALTLLLSNQSLRQIYGQQATQRVSSWSWLRISNAYWTLLTNKSSNHLKDPPPAIHPNFFLDDFDNAAFWSGSSLYSFLGTPISFPNESFDSVTPSSLILDTDYSLATEDEIVEIDVFSKTSLEKSFFLNGKYCSMTTKKNQVNILNCLYSLYVDSEIQINGAVFDDGTIRTIAIRIPEVYILVQEGIPIDIEENFHLKDRNIVVEYHPSRITLSTKSILVTVDNSQVENGITLQISNISRFASPKGIIGSTLRNKFDEFKKYSEAITSTSPASSDWSQWIIEDENLFSIQSKGQSWSMFSIEANVFYIPSLHDLPQNSMEYQNKWISSGASHSTPVSLIRDTYPVISEKNFIPVVTMQFEGPFFDFSGFATVNRALFMELLWNSSKIMIRLAPTDADININEGANPPLLNSVVKYLMWANIVASRPSSNLVTKVIRNFGTIQPSRNSIGTVSRTSIAAPFSNVDSVFQPRHIQPNFAISEPLLASLLLRLFPLLATSIGKKEDCGIGSLDAAPDVVFRNAWLGDVGPDLSLPLSISTFWIQSQPWEFWGIPESWLSKLSLVDTLIVPSIFSKDSYIANGIESDKIVVLPHGVTFEKIQKIVSSFDEFGVKENSTSHFIKSLPGCSKFIAMFSGGLLARKGVDVAVKAFISSFKRSDEACLVMHAVYGDGYYVEQIKAHQEDYETASKDPSLVISYPSRYDIPRIVYLNHALDWSEMIKLFHISDLFLAPYRAEGFGLIILEAMAAGTAVAVTQAGPALEFTNSESIFYISQDDYTENDHADEFVYRHEPFEKSEWRSRSLPKALCRISPCGPGLSEVKGIKTKVPPRWAAPSITSLRKILQLSYNNPYLVNEKAKKGLELASKHTWTEPGVELVALIQKMVLNTKNDSEKDVVDGSDNGTFLIPIRLRETLCQLKGTCDATSYTIEKEGKGYNMDALSNNPLKEPFSSSVEPSNSMDDAFSIRGVFQSAMSLPSAIGLWILKCIF